LKGVATVEIVPLMERIKNFISLNGGRTLKLFDYRNRL
jgi:hypothetical protein